MPSGHFEHYILAHILSSEHPLALEIGADKVFDNKSINDIRFAKNEDFNEILAENGISISAPKCGP